MSEKQSEVFDATDQDQPQGETALEVSGKSDIQVPVSLEDGLTFATIEEQTAILADYDAKYTHFKKWLLSKLQKGIHYGFPPGCEAKYDDEGNLLQYIKKTGKWLKVPPTQWQPKPSLYLDGAIYLRDILKLRPEYSADNELFEQMGRPQKVIVRKCELFSRSTGEKLSEGTGAYRVGEKGGDENTAIQMAEKRAFVSATRRTTAVITNLFTENQEDLPPEGAQPEMDLDFPELVQKWVDSKKIPHTVTDLEVQALRANMKIWVKQSGVKPTTAEDGIAWCKKNVNIVTIEGTDGSIAGIKFERK